MYPLLQGTDSVAVRADIEIGGSDQLLNLLMGRDLQERAGQPPQSVVTVPLLVGTDGSAKMSQSLGNYISIRDTADEMFGKTMSIPDDVIPQWLRLAAGADPSMVAEVERGLVDGDLHPGEAKRDLARRVVDRHWGPGSGADAEEAFDRIFRDKEAPEDVVEYAIAADGATVWVPGLLAESGLASSNSEARRLVAEGAVRVDGVRLDAEDIPLADLTGRVVQVGKRRFIRFV
jgi:tyrosyl-tRNA synthetase